MQTRAKKSKKDIGAPLWSWCIDVTSSSNFQDTIVLHIHLGALVLHDHCVLEGNHLKINWCLTLALKHQ